MLLQVFNMCSMQENVNHGMVHGNDFARQQKIKKYFKQALGRLGKLVVGSYRDILLIYSFSDSFISEENKRVNLSVQTCRNFSSKVIKIDEIYVAKLNVRSHWLSLVLHFRRKSKRGSFVLKGGKRIYFPNRSTKCGLKWKNDRTSNKAAKYKNLHKKDKNKLIKINRDYNSILSVILSFLFFPSFSIFFLVLFSFSLHKLSSQFTCF